MTHTHTNAAELARLTGMSKRQIQRLAAAGLIDGCTPSKDGYHRTYAVTDATHAWVVKQATRTKNRRQALANPRVPTKHAPSDIALLTNQVQRALGFVRKWQSKQPVSKWSTGVKASVCSTLKPLVELYEQLNNPNKSPVSRRERAAQEKERDRAAMMSVWSR